MQTIKRDIYVTKNVLQAPIEVTEGTNSIAIEFDVRDYEIPASAAAVAYSLSTSSMEEPNKALADVSGNKITIIPSEAFFLPGQNVMQVRIIDGNSKLISFNIIVKCTGKMRFGDEDEEGQSTLIEQILAKLGEYTGKLDVERKRIDNLDSTKANKTDLTSPYNFKGSCLSSALPASGNTVNDTYYCTDLKYRKTWNGSAWEQSSLNEADYEDELTKTNGEVSSLKEDLVNQEYWRNSKNYKTIWGKIRNDAFYNVVTHRIENINNYSDMVIDVNGGDILKYTSSVRGTAHSALVFTDSNDEFISYVGRAPSVDVSTIVSGYSVVPQNAKYCHFSVDNNLLYNVYYNEFYIQKLERINYENVNIKFNNFKEIKKGYYYDLCGEFMENENYSCAIVEVNNGDIFKVSRTIFGLGVFTHMFTDDNYSLLYARNVAGEQQRYIDNEIIEIPYDSSIKYMMLNFVNTTKDFSVTKIEKQTYNNILNFWNGKKMNVLGDSKTHGDIVGTGVITPLSWTYYIPSLTGLDICRNYGISGTTISGSASNSFVNRYSNMDNDAELICVYGGINDHLNSRPLGNYGDSTKETFYGALELLISGLIKKYPTSYIFFITPMKYNRGYGGTVTGGDSVNDDGHILKDYVNAIYEMCDKYSIPILDFYKYGGITPYITEQYNELMPDKLHENEKGYERTAHRIAGFIKTLC